MLLEGELDLEIANQIQNTLWIFLKQNLILKNIQSYPQTRISQVVLKSHIFMLRYLSHTTCCRMHVETSVHYNICDHLYVIANTNNVW